MAPAGIPGLGDRARSEAPKGQYGPRGLVNGSMTGNRRKFSAGNLLLFSKGPHYENELVEVFWRDHHDIMIVVRGNAFLLYVIT